MVTGTEIGGVVGKVFGIAVPFLKTQAERSEWCQQKLKDLGIPEAEHPNDFKTVYAIALVKCAAEVQNRETWELMSRLLKEETIVEAFRSTYNQGDYSILLGAVEKCLEQLALGDEIRELGIDCKPICYDFTQRFLQVAQRSQTPAQSFQSLEAKIYHRQSQRTILELRQEIQLLAETVTKLLPAGKPEDLPQESVLAKQMRSWFEVLNYEFDDYQHVDERGFEWIIRIKARRGYDRVLIRGVDGEARVSDVRRLQAVAEGQKLDEILLVATLRISPAAKTLWEEDDRFRCLTFDELLDDEADFSTYLDWLEGEIQKRDIADRYVPLACSKEEVDHQLVALGERSRYGEAEGWIDGCVDRWLEDSSKEHVSVLGVFGKGKTWFTLHYAWKALQKYRDAKAKGVARPRLPLIIPLRDYAKAAKVDNIIAGFFFTEHNIRLTAEVFDQLNQMGKLLLIFDGFDEMAARVDRQQMIEQFWELAKLVKPGAKVILTCRTEHFPQALEGRRFFNSEIQASIDRLQALPKTQFEVLELEKFSDDQIRQVLSFQASDATIETVMGNPQLLDLARRPVMVELVIEAMPEIESGKPIDLARVYLYAVQRKMARDIQSGRTFTSMADKLYFLCELSWEMVRSDRMSLNYRDFPDRLQKFFGPVVQESKTLDYWQQDMRAQSMLIRNSEGDYTPAHRSLLEFFVAYRLVAMLGVMDADFMTVAVRSDGQLDESVAAKSYDWKEYFQHQLDDQGEIMPMAQITRFSQESLGEIYSALQGSPLAKAVLELAIPMLDAGTVRDRLLDLVRTTRGKTIAEAGYVGTNAIELLLGQQPYALDRANLSGVVLRNLNLMNRRLRQTNLSGSTLAGVAFNRVLSEVLSVAYSPDGIRMAIGDKAGRLQVWDAQTGEVLLLWEGHSDTVSSVVYSPDGKTIASGSYDNTVKVWDGLTGELLRTLDGHEDEVWSVMYSPDGKMIASGSSDNTVKIRDGLTGELLRTLDGHENTVSSMVYSPNGKTIATGSLDNMVKIWDGLTGELSRTLEGHLDMVFSVVYSPDGETIASGSSDTTVKVWNGLTGELLRTLQGHSDKVDSVVYSPDGKTIASGSDDTTVKIWDALTGELLRTSEGHSNGVTSVVYSPDGETIASGSVDETVKVWDRWTSELLRTLEGHPGWVTSVVYSPDGKTIANSSADKMVKVWDGVTGELLRTLEGHSDIVWSVVYSPEGKMIASSSGDKTMKVWDVLTGALLRTSQSHSDTILSVVYSPDGKTIASGSGYKTVEVWNVLTGELLQTLADHSDTILSVVYSPDGKTIVSSSEDKTVKVWNVLTGELLQTLEGHSDRIWSVVYSPDGKTIASGSHDKTVKVWDGGTGNLLRTLEGHSDMVLSVIYSPDGKMIASGGVGKTVKVWDPSTGALLQTLEGHSSNVWSVVYSPDGKTIASGSSDGTIRFWDTETWQCRETIDNRLYANLNITDVKGITEAQRRTLKAYGAVEEVRIENAEVRMEEME